MTNEEIMHGLKKAKENNPKATIGLAIEQMFGINPFSKKDAHSDNSCFVYANYPSDEYDEQELMKTICEIYSMSTLNLLELNGDDANYGVSIEDGLKLQAPGHCSPLSPATISHRQIWHLLSSYYNIV